MHPKAFFKELLLSPHFDAVARFPPFVCRQQPPVFCLGALLGGYPTWESLDSAPCCTSIIHLTHSSAPVAQLAVELGENAQNKGVIV